MNMNLKSVCKQECPRKHLKPKMTEESIDLGSYITRDLVIETGHLVLLGQPRKTGLSVVQSSGKEFSLRCPSGELMRLMRLPLRYC
jgi:hypothetical protein